MKEYQNLFYEDSLFSIEKKVLVALSGGPDSIFVLEILKEIQKERDLEIHLYHLNHQLRETAFRDENFVKRLAQDEGFKLHLESCNIKKYAAERGVGTEEAGRIKRYESLKSIADTIGTKTVITGHHLGDDIETVIMNFERGAGLTGMSGIRIREGIYFRPLLGIGKAEILEYLEKKGVTYCIDETNFIDNVYRNDIRINKVPRLRELFDNFEGNFKKVVNNLKTTSRTLDDIIDFFLRDAYFEDGRISISINKMMNFFPNHREDLYLNIIKRLNLTKKDVYSYHLRQIERILCSKGEKQVGFSGVRVIKSYDKLIFERIDRMDKTEDQPLPGEFYLSEEASSGSISLDKDGIIGRVEFSKRRPGDIFETLGGKRKKLKDLLIDEKIPRYKRDKILVLRDEKGIIYVEDLWLARRVLPNEKTVKKIYLRR